MSEFDTIRVGAVNYLNTKPLIYGFEQLAPHAQLELDLPSRLADRLAAGELDVALIPSIEAFRNPLYTIISDACIACRGPVLSVKLFSRMPVSAIRTLALDEGSRTSVALSRILLGDRYGVEPELRPLPIGATLEETTTDAVLLIGDRAIHSPMERFEFVWDLGDQWWRWTGRPFVFAMWTARPGVDLQGVDVALGEARDSGVARLGEIAAAEAAALGLSEPECLSYLQDNLYFYLGEEERAGLAHFYRLAVRRNLAPEGVDLGLGICRSAG